jgi:ethanolaminephosphotransferase
MTIPEQELHDVSAPVLDPSALVAPSTSDTNGAQTASALIPKDDDVMHKTPYDQHELVVWINEPTPLRGVLTQDGVTQIAYHTYRPGTYTWLDTQLNPVWAGLTELLPLTVAPNLITALGGAHCLFSYLLTTWIVPHYFLLTDDNDNVVPTWVLLVNGYCNIVYYTLDCMDGKQARRTNTSSPLGQLFDHGVDCLCLLSHLSMVQAWFGAPPSVVLTIQAYLQFSFFCAQWEEYYTGVLPHATGNVGVTEVNYGLALVSVANAAWRQGGKALYGSNLMELLRKCANDSSSLSSSSSLHRLLDVVVQPALDSLQVTHVRDLMALGWYTMTTILVALSVARVCRHVAPTQRLPALLKLATPLGVWYLACTRIPDHVLDANVRTISLAIGVACGLITIKLIVFSMARQSYAILQKEAIPILVGVLWTSDERWTDLGVRTLWQVVCAYYVIRLVVWNRAAITQICERMGIQLFVIKPKRV